MSGIKNKGTKPEILVRKELFGAGFRYRINNSRLPGKPDMVLKKYMAVVFVHGCFWHGHDCRYFVWPKSNRTFWRKKISGNKRNDAVVVDKLRDLGYRVCIFWECVTRDTTLFPVAIDKLKSWLYGHDDFLEISL